MADDRAPDVYIDESPMRPKSIVGVSTSTAAFVGPCLTGPLDAVTLVTSLADFEGVYGGERNFLVGEWRAGGLIGTKPDEAFFVKCDRTTMTQNDLDNGRLVCLVGVAVLKPAEFVIFRVRGHGLRRRGVLVLNWF